MNRNRIRILCIGLLMLASLSGCNREKGTGSTEARPRVALVMKSLANEFFKTMQDGAEAHQKAHSSEYELISTGIKNETDVDQQIALVEQMVAQKVDAIVLAPADSKALVPACKHARDAGVIVINIDNKLDADALKEKGLAVPFVGPNNRKGAKLAGEYLATKLKSGDPVAIIDGVPGAFNAIQRHDGFEDAMKEHGMTIVTSQSAQWETDKATPVVSSILNAHPEVKAFLCANDSMCLGAHTALKDANRIGQVQLVGFDNIPAVRELIRKGEVLCTVDQHADQIAVNGIEYALEILKAHTTPTDKETPVDLITAQTLKK